MQKKESKGGDGGDSKNSKEGVGEYEINEELLVPLDDYLVNGIHVGLKYKTKDMEDFIYKVRPDKLCVFDVKKIDERLRIAAKFISRYEPEDILVVSNRVYGREPIKQFSKYTGIKAITERFVSGTLTNPEIQHYVEPKLLVVTDPTVDQQAVKEAALSGIPIIAICDTNTRVKRIDFVIPSNNKGKNSLALIYWILTKEVLKESNGRGGKKKEFNVPLEEFISKAETRQYIIEMQSKQRLRRRGGRKRKGTRRKK
jgi:small subunit ribosomal protein S2